MRAATRLLAVFFALVCIVVATVLGDGYIDRMPNHAGYFLVSVDDRAQAPSGWRPRHTAFIVVDGLRRDAAERMKVTHDLQRFGQCRISDQGSYTVSRPEYALLSTGLEVDRTGSRNNDLTTPIAVESVWQVARESGLRVVGSSHLPWFKELFPGGFDRYERHEEHSANVFAAGADALADVNVFHPIYADENAHEHGAASPEYAAAVERADREIADLLARMDLTQDLVVLTADHGHRDAGGHGGGQPEIRNVLVCFAGKNVVRREDRALFDGRTTAPLVSVLLGLRFPRNMRAGEDGLDPIWEIVRNDVNPEEAAFLRDRHLAVERFRDRNRVPLESWLGGSPGTWSRLYEREARAQVLRGLIATLILLLGGGTLLRIRRVPLREVVERVAFVAVAAFVIWAVHRMVLGAFDYSVINQRKQFVPRAFATATIAALVTLVAQRLVKPSRPRGDWFLLVAALLAVNVGHVVMYGWPLGFPLPPPAARYFPFFGAIALATYAAIGIVLVVVDAVRQRMAPKAQVPSVASK